MTTIFIKDPLRASVETASDETMTVMYDDLGQPSYMVRIPAFNLQDIDPIYGSGVHPAFLVNGVPKSEIWIGAYQAKVINGRACSLPDMDPTVNINFDDTKAACTAKGAGCHLMTNWEWAAVALWCLKNGFQPRGNTYHGRSHETVYLDFETMQLGHCTMITSKTKTYPLNKSNIEKNLKGQLFGLDDACEVCKLYETSRDVFHSSFINKIPINYSFENTDTLLW